VKLRIHPAAFLLGALLFSSLWLWLRSPLPSVGTADVPRSSRPGPVQRSSITLDVATLERYVGRYEGRGGFTADLTLKNGRLFAQSGGTAPFELLATSKTEFFLKGADVDVKFRLGDGGRVEGFVAETEFGVVYADRVR
jgi:hypothetical protein